VQAIGGLEPPSAPPPPSLPPSLLTLQSASTPKTGYSQEYHAVTTLPVSLQFSQLNIMRLARCAQDAVQGLKAT
jgi:hypothetical protein